MTTYPLYSHTVEEATALQFHIVDCATRCFNGAQTLETGDLGIVPGLNRPRQTARVEKVFADVFDAEDACLVRGAGTGALRWALAACVPAGGRLLVHDAPVYPTTQVTADTMGLTLIRADYNDEEALKTVLLQQGRTLDGILIQHTRQKPDDRYELGCVAALCRRLAPGVPIITDDNYAALKVKKIGCQCGAELSTFSCFKILGPEGVGVVLGRGAAVQRVREMQYSGGSQVQGHEAMAALRGLIYAPLVLAVSGSVCDSVAGRLAGGEVPHVKNAWVANSQSRVLIVEFDAEIARQVLEAAPAFGAAPHPVGCESRYEFAPMFYRLSGTFRAVDPEWEKRMIRINVMRAGPETILRILRAAIQQVAP